MEVILIHVLLSNRNAAAHGHFYVIVYTWSTHLGHHFLPEIAMPLHKKQETYPHFEWWIATGCVRLDRGD